MTEATPASQEEWARHHPGRRRCDVWRAFGGADCAGVSVAWFTAECERGHVMAGGACASCKNAVKLGCANCLESGRGYQKVTITWEALELVDA